MMSKVKNGSRLLTGWGLFTFGWPKLLDFTGCRFTVRSLGFTVLALWLWSLVDCKFSHPTSLYWHLNYILKMAVWFL